MSQTDRAGSPFASIALMAGLSALVGILSGCAGGAAGLRGRLILPQPASGTLRSSDPQEGLTIFGAQDAVISLIPKDEQESKAAATHPKIEENARGFEPRVLAVPVGSKVEFLNHDHVYHKAFSISPAKKFNLGAQVPGGTHSVVFNHTGVVNLYCELHPAAVGFIVVLPNELFTKPNARGEFAFPDLGEGTYTVLVWHPRYGELRRQVKVPRGGETDLELAY